MRKFLTKQGCNVFPITETSCFPKKIEGNKKEGEREERGEDRNNKNNTTNTNNFPPLLPKEENKEAKGRNDFGIDLR